GGRPDRRRHRGPGEDGAGPRAGDRQADRPRLRPDARAGRVPAETLSVAGTPARAYAGGVSDEGDFDASRSPRRRHGPADRAALPRADPPASADANPGAASGPAAADHAAGGRDGDDRQDACRPRHRHDEDLHADTLRAGRAGADREGFDEGDDPEDAGGARRRHDLAPDLRRADPLAHRQYHSARLPDGDDRRLSRATGTLRGAGADLPALPAWWRGSGALADRRDGRDARGPPLARYPALLLQCLLDR